MITLMSGGYGSNKIDVGVNSVIKSLFGGYGSNWPIEKKPTIVQQKVLLLHSHYSDHLHDKLSFILHPIRRKPRSMRARTYTELI